MTGHDKAKATANKIRSEVEAKAEKENKKTEQATKALAESRATIEVESSKSLAQVQRNMDIVGLEGVPSSIMPVPFYKLVQPGSTNIDIGDGTEAAVGSFYMRDTGKAVDQLRFVMLRAKRQHREFTSNEGKFIKTTSMGILGFNLERQSAFILTVSITSFSGFGQLMAQFKEKGVTKAWQYPVVVNSEKVVKQKLVAGQLKTVKYYVMNFQMEDKELDEEQQAMLDLAYQQYATTLDRDQDMKTNEPNGSVESTGKDEIPF